MITLKKFSHKFWEYRMKKFYYNTINSWFKCCTQCRFCPMIKHFDKNFELLNWSGFWVILGLIWSVLDYFRLNLALFGIDEGFETKKFRNVLDYMPHSAIMLLKNFETFINEKEWVGKNFESHVNLKSHLLWRLSWCNSNNDTRQNLRVYKKF